MDVPSGQDSGRQADAGASQESKASRSALEAWEKRESTRMRCTAQWASIIASTITALKDVKRPSYALPKSIPGTIDHTLLKLDATPAQIDNLCAEARVHAFATVCVRPNWVARCVANLKGSGVGVASVVGFHEGTGDLYQKLE